MGFIEKVLEWLARLAGPLADLLREIGRFAAVFLDARQPGPQAVAA